MASYLITDASRGIGLAMASYLMTLSTSEVERVFATAPRESTALKSLVQDSAGRVHFIELDIANERSFNLAIAEIETFLDGAGLDILINNTGKTPVAPKAMSIMCVQSTKVWAVCKY